MAGKTELIEEIRSRVDLVSLVGEYVSLRRSGRRYVGLCPFHQERTPSFTVNPEGQFFYCFGCKASGDAFEFIMRLEGLDFPAAVKLLAERVGLRWEPQTPGEAAREKRRSALLRLNAMAAEVYRRALWAPRTGAEAREYLARRGVERATAEKFGLGYAPPGPRTLVEVFRRYGLRLEDGVALGLVLPSAEGYLDRFRDRLIFPLVDPRGRVVGFGGRILNEGEPKYLNSPESELFAKRRFLYGFPLAREAIRRSGRVVLVEGYLDAIAAHRAGVDNAVATLGTALSEDHAELLRRFATEVILAYDGDEAGQEATVRGLELLQRHGLQIRVAVLPAGQDPDDLVRWEGGEAFRSLLAAALPLTEFLLQRALAKADLSTPEGRAAAVRACLPALAEVASAAARETYLRQVARWTRVHEDTIAKDLADYVRETRKNRHMMDKERRDSNTNRCDVNLKESSAHPAEKELLRTILKEYSLVARIKEELKPEDFTPGPWRELYNFLGGLSFEGPPAEAELLRRAPEELRPLLRELLVAGDGEDAPPLRPEAFAKCGRRIKAAALRRRLAELEATRIALETAGETGERLLACLREEQTVRQELETYRTELGFGV
ncbi:MAG: DNA primase [Firmicutes bacterium]|nr:DNA primase [Bacillota bacterium]